MHKDPLNLFDWAYVLVCLLLLLAFAGWMNQIIRDLLWVLFSYSGQGLVFAVGLP